ncbi:MAG: carboxypeptidase-like regulatory domain-containing protein [Bacteroidota bacterium]
MSKQFILLLILFSFSSSFAQSGEELQVISGKVENAANDKPLESVNIVNTSKVKGYTTDQDGKFTIMAAVNDTLHFSYLGFKPIQVKITEDWVKYGDVKIKMTETAIALEEVTVKSIKLSGFLEIDAKNIPIYENHQYSISGLDYAYEGGQYQRNAFSKAVESIFNPTDFLYKIFGQRPQQMRKLRKMKADDEIRNILQDKYDRETLSAVLNISKPDIDDILKRCNYSKSFIKSANDLQILDAISSCYEEYRAVNR